MDQILRKRVVPVPIIDHFDDAIPFVEALMAGT